MAQLPSGRHIAIQATALFELIDASCMPDTVITRLLRIEREVDLFPYIEVMFFREAADAALPEIAPGGQSVPAGIEPYESGYSLATIGAAIADWPPADQRAFAEYLDSGRVRNHLSALLDKVAEVKYRLGREGDFVLRFQALIWERGCHPVQNDDREDPMYAWLQVNDTNADGDAP
ncbi:MAG TPA: hypothetical protein VFN25_15510 [Dokdonella sp.]|uniref:hypothetical protein n=1 Tax=Dokdonella sp. TaxID=2291710 RepID=UPI002D80A784|nr:hypothetical protein [Dokdonella sp.]HET9034297.1 hypothetical protein [Dokdonella sp.]